MATATGRNPIPNGTADEDAGALEPLYDWINPDALDALFRTTGKRTPGTGTVTFAYCGYEVTVEKTATVSVTVREDSDEE
ncbi:HalOD1 output domain-containing protein [Haladaptatus sp. NG-WS-4]